jgi:hypothetical protein
MKFTRSLDVTLFTADPKSHILILYNVQYQRDVCVD